MMTTKHKINLQLFADGEEAPEGTWVWHDPQTGEKHIVPAMIGNIKADVLYGHMVSGLRKPISKEIESKYERQLRELKEAASSKEMTMTELQSKLQEMEDEKLTLTERQKKEFERSQEKILKDLKAREDELNGWKNKYSQTLIDNTIYSSLPQGLVHNPQQTSIIIKQLLQPEIVSSEKGDEVFLNFAIDGEQKKMPAQDAVKLFLAQPGNEHHLRSNLQAGAGTSKSASVTENGGLRFSREKLANDPSARKEYLEKMKNGQNVEMK